MDEKTKNVRSIEEKKNKKQAAGNNYLFVIGIDEYENFDKLNNAVKDAKDFVKVLCDKYGYTTDPAYFYSLYNKQATKEKIEKTFFKLKKKIKKNDNLTIYFSGHGTLDELEQAFWIPVAAEKEEEFTYYDTRSVKNAIADIQSHHTLMIADACFSGNLFVGRYKGVLEEKLKTKISRWGLTSGRAELVSDGRKGENSPFAEALLKVLGENTEEAFAISDLGQAVKHIVGNNQKQTPRCDRLFGVGDEGGEMIFYQQKTEDAKELEALEAAKLSKQACLAYLETPTYSTYRSEVQRLFEAFEEEEFWNKSQHLFSYSDYLNIYPKGKYATEAKKQLAGKGGSEKPAEPEIPEPKDGKRAQVTEKVIAFVRKHKGKWKNYDWMLFTDEMHEQFGASDAYVKSVLDTEIEKKKIELDKKAEQKQIAKRKKEERERKYFVAAKADWENSQDTTGLKKFIASFPKSNFIAEVKKILYPNFTETAAGLSLEMIAIQGGSFMMGSEDGGSDEKPVHEVTVSDFYMGKYELTIAEYLVFCKETDSNYPEWLEKGNEYNIHENGKKKDYYKKRGMQESNENHPITGVSWDNVVAYCEWLSKKTGKTYRLPTEAEWEYAAGGGVETHGRASLKYASNNDRLSSVNLHGDRASLKYAGSNNIDEVAWYDENSDNKTHEVGTKKPNALGLYDMSGNVWEWCQDWFDEDYYKNSPKKNPQGAENGESRVLRGGSWLSCAADSRVALRYSGTPDYSSGNSGCRLSCSLQFTS